MVRYLPSMEQMLPNETRVYTDSEPGAQKMLISYFRLPTDAQQATLYSTRIERPTGDVYKGRLTWYMPAAPLEEQTKDMGEWEDEWIETYHDISFVMKHAVSDTANAVADWWHDALRNHLSAAALVPVPDSELPLEEPIPEVSTEQLKAFRSHLQDQVFETFLYSRFDPLTIFYRDKPGNMVAAAAAAAEINMPQRPLRAVMFLDGYDVYASLGGGVPLEKIYEVGLYARDSDEAPVNK